MKKFFSKLFFALVDQGAFAMANFLVNIQLARLLQPKEYGQFGLAFTIFTLVSVVLSAFLVEPMMINGSSTFAKNLKSYLGFLVRDFWKFVTPICAFLILLIGGIYNEPEIFLLIVVLALGIGPLCFQFFIRRVCYLYRKPWVAAVGGLTYLSLILISTFLVDRVDHLNSQTGLGLMIFSAILGTTVMVMSLRKTLLNSPAESANISSSEVRSVHLKYGRWSVVTSILSWIPANIYILLLPIFWSYEKVGLLRASLNLILPVIQIQLAMTPLLLPWLVRQIHTSTFQLRLRQIGALLILFPTLWTLCLAIFGQALLEFAYDGKYETSSMTLFLLGMTTMVSALVLTLSAAIKAHSEPKLLIRGYSLATLSSLVIGIPLMIWYGVLGVIVGMLIAASVNLLTLFRQFNRLLVSRNTTLPVHRPS